MADSWWDSRTRPCLNSVSITSMNLFQETTDHSTTTTTTCSGSGGGGDPNLHMMELGLSSQPISQPLDWNQALYRGDQRNDHHQSGYNHTVIQENHGLSSNTTNFQENQLWKAHKMYSESSPNSEFKQINEHARYTDENRLNPGFQHMDHSYGSNSTLIQSLFGSDSNTSLQQDSGYDQNQGMSYSYPSSYGTGMTISGGSGGCGGGGGDQYPPPPPQQEFSTNSQSKVEPDTQLHFSNNARFWNASAASMNDIRSSFFPLQMQSPSPTIEDKPKNPISEMVKRSNTKSSSTKRPRNENPPLMPPSKVKMGDRITALQQLVSPFGKTDTASVLSEAIIYIKFLHEQVNVLSTPYMNNAAIMQQQKQILDKSSDKSRHDLRTRGLCLVPISSTFPMTNETPVDFWTPSFGGTFR